MGSEMCIRDRSDEREASSRSVSSRRVGRNARSLSRTNESVVFKISHHRTPRPRSTRRFALDALVVTYKKNRAFYARPLASIRHMASRASLSASVCSGFPTLIRMHPEMLAGLT